MDQAELRRPALLWAVAAGVLADALVRVPGRPGLNVALWALGGVAVLAVLLRRRADPRRGSHAGWSGARSVSPLRSRCAMPKHWPCSACSPP